jgi:hypothetical protein
LIYFRHFTLDYAIDFRHFCFIAADAAAGFSFSFSIFITPLPRYCIAFLMRFRHRPLPAASFRAGFCHFATATLITLSYFRFISPAPPFHHAAD